MLILRSNVPLQSLIDHYTRKIKSLIHTSVSCSVHYDYLVDVEQELTLDQRSCLAKLLNGEWLENFSEAGTFWVIPRIGTISAWSSKTTQLAYDCGITYVKRIEQATCVHLYSSQMNFRGCCLRPLRNPHVFHIHSGSLGARRLPEKSSALSIDPPKLSLNQNIVNLFVDRMTQTAIFHLQEARKLFTHNLPKTFETIPLLEQGMDALIMLNQSMGLALSDFEMQYLYEAYKTLKRDPTDVELMMFAQVNSEHCRHKIFNAAWLVNGQSVEESLFAKIRYTAECSPENIVLAYEDNAAIIKGSEIQALQVEWGSGQYTTTNQYADILIKVETHNHPTAIAPFEGAGTGSGGEIRDEGATGRGGKPKAGLTGFSVSHLRIPGSIQPYETVWNGPSNIATPLEIMLKAPIGAARYNNEFGRPNLCGYFRTFELKSAWGDYGYHKPIMIAGGLGSIFSEQTIKKELSEGVNILVVGGPSMAIGLGGGAASSLYKGASTDALDFESVQRQNPEMQRRVQEVIDTLTSMGTNNPILSIHDVGAGGLSNAVIELVAQGGMGARIDLRKIPNVEADMTPLAIWCNEAQERYVLAIEADKISIFDQVATRERCPYAVIGTTTRAKILEVHDPLFDSYPVRVPLSLMLESSPKFLKIASTPQERKFEYANEELALNIALENVLQFPTVADKTFLITIGDRSVGGLVHRDQMVGPWQVPVADCAVTLRDFHSNQGEAMAIGERAPLSVLDPKASARMSIGEALTNILAADIEKLSDIKLSCNWMAACGDDQEDNFLFHAVNAVGKEMCPQLGIAIPVGKDSLSMRTKGCGPTKEEEIKAPLSLVVSAFAPIKNIHATLTPELSERSQTLWFLDLARNHRRLGGSCYQQIQNKFGEETPDVDDITFFKECLLAIIELKQAKVLLAYHDRSDGGLWSTLVEMAFASKVGLAIDLTPFVSTHSEALRFLLNEELGVILQVDETHLITFNEILSKYNIKRWCQPIARIHEHVSIAVMFQEQVLYKNSRTALHLLWSKVSYDMQKIRDNEQCAKEAYAILEEENNPGLLATHVSFSHMEPMFQTKPKVAILRDQGVNGQREMAYAFMEAGFEAFDVTMTDLLTQRFDLKNFQVIAACGGFSYGDVLGAGVGWANTILFHEKLLEMFVNFFTRTDTLTLGVCNGCQMLSSLKTIIPGAGFWPKFVHNRSQQFEARLSLVEAHSSSIWFRDMEGSRLPIVVSHGEGKVQFEYDTDLQQLQSKELINLQFIHPKKLLPTEHYPYNPNGSTQGIAAISSEDERATIIMPHPERVVRCAQLSWAPKHWQGKSPWQQLFYNARLWLK